MTQTRRPKQELIDNMPSSFEGISAEDVRDILESYVHKDNFDAFDGHSDSLHTSGSPLAVSSGVLFQYTVDSLGFSQSNRPPGDDEYWNSSNNLIEMPRMNEIYTARMGFVFNQSGGASGQSIDFDFVIPDPGGDIPIGSFTRPILKNTNNKFLENFQFFVGAELLVSGLRLDLTSTVNGDLFDKTMTLLRI